VSSYYRSIDTRVSGEYAVNLIDDCLRILGKQGKEALTGTTYVNNTSDSAFFVQIQFRPGNGAPRRKYKLVSIEADPDAKLSCSAKSGMNVVET